MNHDEVMFFILKLSNACEYFWTVLYLAHNDLKLENLLLDKDFNVVLCDFDHVTLISSNLTHKSIGTKAFRAPEID